MNGKTKNKNNTKKRTENWVTSSLVAMCKPANFKYTIDNLPLSLSLILLNRSTQRLSSSFGVFSKPFLCESFNASSTKTVCTMDWNSPSVYMFHSSFAACSLDRRKVKIIEPLEVFTNAAPLGRCYKNKAMHPIVIIIITREDKTRELIFHVGPIPRASTICSRFPPKIPVISQNVPQKKVFVTKVAKKKFFLVALLLHWVWCKNCKLYNKSKISKHLVQFCGVINQRC